MAWRRSAVSKRLETADRVWIAFVLASSTTGRSSFGIASDSFASQIASVDALTEGADVDPGTAILISAGVGLAVGYITYEVMKDVEEKPATKAQVEVTFDASNWNSAVSVMVVAADLNPRDTTILHDVTDVNCVLDVIQRIRIQYLKVGQLAHFE